jgi:hypothetical protein
MSRQLPFRSLPANLSRRRSFLHLCSVRPVAVFAALRSLQLLTTVTLSLLSTLNDYYIQYIELGYPAFSLHWIPTGVGPSNDNLARPRKVQLSGYIYIRII